MRLLLIPVLLLLLPACNPGPFYQAYSGPMLAPAEHARIAPTPLTNPLSRISISCVDGKSTDTSWLPPADQHPPEAFVLPGRHYITVLYVEPPYWVEAALWLDAQAGRTYYIDWETRFGGMGFWLFDGDTKAVVGGTVGSEPNPSQGDRICVPRRSM